MIFTKGFWQELTQANDFETVLDDIPSGVSEAQKMMLLSAISLIKVKKALFGMRGDKVLGLDFFFPGFF